MVQNLNLAINQLLIVGKNFVAGVRNGMEG